MKAPLLFFLSTVGSLAPPQREPPPAPVITLCEIRKQQCDHQLKKIRSDLHVRAFYVRISICGTLSGLSGLGGEPRLTWISLLLVYCLPIKARAWSFFRLGNLASKASTTRALSSGSSCEAK